MFIPAYKIDEFRTDKEALSFLEIKVETLNPSFDVKIISGEIPPNSSVKLITPDEPVLLVYHSNGVDLWVSDSNWFCEQLDEAEEVIESIENGIRAEFWAVFKIT